MFEHLSTAYMDARYSRDTPGSRSSTISPIDSNFPQSAFANSNARTPLQNSTGPFNNHGAHNLHNGQSIPYNELSLFTRPANDSSASLDTAQLALQLFEKNVAYERVEAQLLESRAQYALLLEKYQAPLSIMDLGPPLRPSLRREDFPLVKMWKQVSESSYSRIHSKFGFLEDKSGRFVGSEYTVNLTAHVKLILHDLLALGLAASTSGGLGKRATTLLINDIEAEYVETAYGDNHWKARQVIVNVYPDWVRRGGKELKHAKRKQTRADDDDSSSQSDNELPAPSKRAKTSTSASTSTSTSASASTSKGPSPRASTMQPPAKPPAQQEGQMNAAPPLSGVQLANALAVLNNPPARRSNPMNIQPVVPRSIQGAAAPATAKDPVAADLAPKRGDMQSSGGSAASHGVEQALSSDAPHAAETRSTIEQAAPECISAMTAAAAMAPPTAGPSEPAKNTVVLPSLPCSEDGTMAPPKPSPPTPAPIPAPTPSPPLLPPPPAPMPMIAVIPTSPEPPIGTPASSSDTTPTAKEPTYTVVPVRVLQAHMHKPEMRVRAAWANGKKGKARDQRLYQAYLDSPAGKIALQNETDAAPSK